MAVLNILEIILSLAFIFFLFSIITSWIQTLISKITNLKGKTLHHTLGRMLTSEEPGKDIEDFYDHPRIKALTEKEKKAPDNIPARDFSFALLDIVKAKGEGNTDDSPITMDSIQKRIKKIENNEGLKKNLSIIFDLSKNMGAVTDDKLKTLFTNVEEWF